MAYQPLAGKTAIITGASKGIGAATAVELSSLGAKVVITYASNPGPADALVTKLGADKALAIRADAGSISDNECVIKEAIAWSGGYIDILVANAGYMNLQTLEATTEEAFQRTYDINVKGPYFLIQKALPYMRSGSRVVLVSTTQCASSNVTPPYLLYVSSKGAVEQMTRVLAKDLASKGINVNCVAPGPTATDLFLDGKDEKTIQFLAGLNPFKRLGTPEDIAKAIAYLSGEGAAWVNGQIIRTNGGMTVGN